MTGWDVYGGTPSVPAGMLAELAVLRAALPGYGVILTSHSPARRSGAIRRDPGPGIWCVVSTGPASLWREAAGRAPPAASRAGRLPRSARTANGSYSAGRIPRLAVRRPGPPASEVRASASSP